MAKKKVKSKRKNISTKSLKNPWFRKKSGLLNSRVPITWQGWVFLILFLALNFYSVFYFKLPYGTIDDMLGFFTVLLLSIFVFLVIAKKKTRGEKDDF